MRTLAMNTHRPINFAFTLTFCIVSSSVMADNIGSPEIIKTCTSCHGTNGNSLNAEFPVLAGQNTEYLARQLSDFKSGQRENAIMQRVAATLTQSEISSLADYYSRQIPAPRTQDRMRLIQGETRYSMCWGCHGVNGEGYDGYPRLANQHPAYLIKQLNNFKNRTRLNPAMNRIADDLTDQDIVALSKYLATINPRSIPGTLSFVP